MLKEITNLAKEGIVLGKEEDKKEIRRFEKASRMYKQPKKEPKTPQPEEE